MKKFLKQLLQWIFKAPDYTIWVRCESSQADVIKEALASIGKSKLKLVKQNHAGLPDAIRSWGCKYRCLQAIAEFSEGRTLSAYDIMTIYDSFAAKNNPKIMNKNCETGTEEHVIINNAFYRLRLDEKRTAKMVGSRNADGDTWAEQEGDFIMYHYAINGRRDGHFVLANSKGKEIFDPWDGKLERGNLIKTMYYKVG